MKELHIEELLALKEHIEDNYAGDYAALNLELSRAIYLLHYVEKEVTGIYDVQDTCFALQRLNECIYHAHHKRWQKQFE
ncbi:hypothetical protein LVD17_27220 [Fulvivirga ulvae]|uniref:hypothetical protein n=1 Tax=Fulvivirga ulvae TaxID=2904245 RepID=UPI001F2C3498|nr:hypothetical protein [Fulvivirga ulvae]UII31983.1 hypothetical protein LVD17_27220 [Fulvivirga ulvae]